MDENYTGFFLSSEDANMQFAHPQTPLRVAPLKTTSSLDDLEIEEVHFAFAEHDENRNIQYFHGLKNFLLFQKSDYPPIYLFDNHNHALYFRYLEFLRTQKIHKLIHIDQHSDMNENSHPLPSSILQTNQSTSVSQFTNRYCNAGNFIQPSLQSGLISEVIQVRTEGGLQR